MMGPIGDLPNKPASLIHARILTPLIQEKASQQQQQKTRISYTLHSHRADNVLLWEQSDHPLQAALSVSHVGAFTSAKE